MSTKSHLDRVRDDVSYADILANWDSAFYAKFTDALRPERAGARLLDVGCGVGQVVAILTREGFEAHGVDVAQANIDRAQRHSPRCIWYDGSRLPYPDRHFESVGALNVVEHVEDPEFFIREVVRVTAMGGRIILSSPNFLRILGWRDYHPRMRGVGNKLRNARALLARRSKMRTDSGAVRFEKMTPIVKDPFTPDDDAIVCTNALDMEFRLRQEGCGIVKSACTDRYVPTVLDWIFNATPLRYGLFNTFVVARRER